ncbi:hypothetical protein MBLNU230_g2637t1 [Neophaeotheca triangularis]
MAKPTLLGLPPELRNRIYEELRERTNHYTWSPQLYLNNNRNPKLPTITQACTQTRAETLPMFTSDLDVYLKSVLVSPRDYHALALATRIKEQKLESLAAFFGHDALRHVKRITIRYHIEYLYARTTNGVPPARDYILEINAPAKSTRITTLDGYSPSVRGSRECRDRQAMVDQVMKSCQFVGVKAVTAENVIDRVEQGLVQAAIEVDQ